MQEDSELRWLEKSILKIGDDKIPKEISGIESILDLSDVDKKIKPWLSRLFQSEHLSLLVGSGLSTAIHKLANPGAPSVDMSGFEIPVFKEQITRAIKDSVQFSGRGVDNIEDQIRVVNDLIKGLEIYTSTGTLQAGELANQLQELKASLSEGIKYFANKILKGENSIITSKSVITASQYLVSFLISCVSRTATRDRLNLFTTNYDRVIEFGCELAGIRLIDRFVGTINPVFRSSRLDIDMHYNPPGIRGEPRYLEGVVRFTKLHGSLDWIYQDKVVRRIALPYGAENIDKYLPTNSSQVNNLMIYPNASKDRETAEYPYVELFRDFAAAIARPNSTLIIYGYSFGDEHINRVIEDMLTIPSTHLVIISYTDEGNRIYQFYERIKIKHSNQITLLIGKHFSDLKNLVDNYLPNIASLSMQDILKQQGYDASSETTQPSSTNEMAES